jgi:CTP synthase
MADQQDAVAGDADLGGTMRLGAYPVLEPGSIVAGAYQAEIERRSTDSVNNALDRIAESGCASRHLTG